MVTVTAHKIYQIFFHPSVVEKVVSVTALGCLPFVETFSHNHHPHLVAGFDQFGCRHIVRCTNGITAHVFEDTYLSADRCVVDCCSQWSQIVMVAYASKVCFHSVQVKAVVRTDLKRTDAESVGLFVFQCIIQVEPCHCRVERWCFGCPEQRIMDPQRGLCIALCQQRRVDF